MPMLLKSVYKLIPEAQRSSGILVILLLTVGAFLDFFSLATFIPVFLLIVDPARVDTYGWLHSFLKSISISGQGEAIAFLTLAAIFFILVKTGIQSWVTYRKARYAYTLADHLASSALARYLAASYTKFTGADYTGEMNRISNLPLTFANNIIIPAGTLISEGLLTLALLSGVAIYSPGAFAMLMIILAPVSWVYVRKRKKIGVISAKIKTIYPRVLKYVLEAIEGLPEIKAYGKESFFKKRFDNTYHQLTDTFSVDHTTHANTSRNTELIAAACIGSLVLYATWFEKSGPETVMLLGFYAGISFRIIPAINRLFAGVLQIKTHEYVLEELQNMVIPETDFSLIQENVERLVFSRSLEIKNVSFGYGEDVILKDVTLTVKKGEKVLLVGKSGIGKTTLLMGLMQFLPSRSGKIMVDGATLTESDSPAWRKLLGYVPQHPYIMDTTIRENIAFGTLPEDIDRAKIDAIIYALDLAPWVKSLTDGVNTVIGEKGLKISGGQRQRLAIARALYHEAEILLLDEVTNQLDRETEREVVRTLDDLAARGKTIIFITHRPELWRSADVVYQISDGVLIRVETAAAV
jgi:ABC-type multidrug transport system fused ATPase/permease subunit